MAWVLRCIVGEDQIAAFCLCMAGKACLHERGVAGFAIARVEVPESPAASCGVLGGVLDHKLNIRGGAWDKGLRLTEDLVVLLRWDVAIVQSGNDGAVREREFPFPVGVDRYIVAQDGTDAVEVAFFMGRGNPPPVAVPLGDFGHERRGDLRIRMAWGRDDEDHKAVDCCGRH